FERPGWGRLRGILVLGRVGNQGGHGFARAGRHDYGSEQEQSSRPDRPTKSHAVVNGGSHVAPPRKKFFVADERANAAHTRCRPHQLGRAISLVGGAGPSSLTTSPTGAVAGVTGPSCSSKSRSAWSASAFSIACSFLASATPSPERSAATRALA